MEDDSNENDNDNRIVQTAVALEVEMMMDFSDLSPRSIYTSKIFFLDMFPLQCFSEALPLVVVIRSVGE